MTVPAPAPAPTPKKRAKRSVDYPEWLPSTYKPARVSSACQCLSIAPSATTATVTATAEAVTVTEEATVTETTTSTLFTIGIVTVTQTPTPTPSPVTLKVRIAVHRKSTDERIGYVYLSNGPAIATDANLAITMDFTVPGGATTGRMLRLVPTGQSLALAFNVPASRELRDFYGGLTVETPSMQL